jgi:hypothetical protein
MNVYMSVKLWKFKRIGGADAVGVVNEKQELSKSNGEVRLLDKVGKILQVVRIATF